jgi:hypothetical protein
MAPQWGEIGVKKIQPAVLVCLKADANPIRKNNFIGAPFGGVIELSSSS